MQPTPKDWPRISSALFYEDAASAIDFLTRAFGFEVRLRVDGPDGKVEHSELTLGEGVIMVGSSGAGRSDRGHCVSPRSLGGKNTQSLCVYVDDVDAHFLRARAAGARIVSEPKSNDYGADYPVHRTYETVDPEGHHWWFMHQLRDGKPTR